MFFFISFVYGEYLWSCNGKEPLNGAADLRTAGAWGANTGAWGANTGAWGIAERAVPGMSIVLLTVRKQKACAMSHSKSKSEESMG